MDRSSDERDVKDDHIRIHVIAPPGTIIDDDYSICAFTHHARMLPEMLRGFGWTTLDYSNEGSKSRADEHITILTRVELDRLSRATSTLQATSINHDNEPLLSLYYRRVIEALVGRTRRGDIVCHTYGPIFDVAHALPECAHVETHVGYASNPGLRFRIYASQAWMHWHYGRSGSVMGERYSWVAPLSYDVMTTATEAATTTTKRTIEGPVVFLGRVVPDKGINTLIEVARRIPERRFMVYGPGDATPWTTSMLPSNVEFCGPVRGRQRWAVLRDAWCVMAPTDYVEPLGAVAIEAQLMGTPVVASSFGGFTETVEHGRTGFLCRTLADWVEAIRRGVAALDGSIITERAERLYSVESVRRVYYEAFCQIHDLFGSEGWFAPTSYAAGLEGRG